MADAAPTNPARPSERLEGWKSIGAYIGRSARAAQRYEDEESLPVFREGGKVFAETDELDRWRAARVVRAGASSGNGSADTLETAAAPMPPAAMPPATALATPSRPKYFRRIVIALTATLALSAAGILWPDEVILTSIGQLTRDGVQKDGRAVSDGTLVFFSEFAGASQQLASVSLTDGLVRKIPLPIRDVHVLQFSTARQSVLVVDEFAHRFFEIPTQSLAPREISLPAFPESKPESVPWTSGAWDSNGRRLALGRPNGCILFEPGARVAPIDLTFLGVVVLAAWHPSRPAARVEVDDVKTGRTAWYDIDAAHPAPVAVPAFSGKRVEKNGDWSHDGKFFVFEARDDPSSSGPSQIWLVDYSHGASPHAWRLTADDRNWRDPVFVSGSYAILAAAAPSQGRLVTLGETPARAASQPALLPGAPAYELDYSRDGQWVAYTRFPEHTIWRSRADGGDPKQLSPSGIEAHQPHWSPDGTRIAFMGKRSGPGARSRIFIVSNRGGPLDEVIPTGDDQGVPTWSPDGRRLYFGDLKSNPGTQAASIHALDLATAAVSTIPAPISLWSPRMSPDGKYLAAVTLDSRSLYVRDNSSGLWRPCVSLSFVGDPVWPPDSSWIQFDGIAEANLTALFRVSPSCKTFRRVLDLSDYRFAGDAWFGIAPDRSPIGLLRVAEEVYALEWRLRHKMP